MKFTGERFVPGAAGEIWYEHWHRYHFAAPLVRDRTVLDVACGAGYGSALLAGSAASVSGVDISTEAIDHARARYAAQGNLAFHAADCGALPFADASFDAVVSFETIEHIAAQEAFLDQARRVLRPGGLLILSCPNKREYSDRRESVNPFHVRELYREELAALLAPRFAHTAWYGQKPSFFSVIWPEADELRGETHGEIFELAEGAADAPASGHGRPLYFIVLASDRAPALDGITPRLSVLADRDEWMYRDYEKVTRELDGAYRRGNALEEQVLVWQAHHREAINANALTVAALQETLAARDASIAAADAWRLKLDADVQDLIQEVRRRAGVRWWLSAPRRWLTDWLKRRSERS
jgi:ubiquinone/menaquinone biosynthesis C-methylase UbiE